jgi:acetyltransferase-like isoleucine patch superfamily enzyme
MKKSLIDRWFSSCLKLKLGRCGADFFAKRGTVIYHPEKVSIGKGVRLGARCDIYVHPRATEEEFILSIGDGVHIGHRCNLACTFSLVIEDKVMIGNDVYIADHSHQYQDLDKPIIDQPVTEGLSTKIESGSWICAKAVIMPGITVGSHAVVGAGAIVTKDVKALTVVAGNPAVMIREYDPIAKKWQRV